MMAGVKVESVAGGRRAFDARRIALVVVGIVIGLIAAEIAARKCFPWASNGLRINRFADSERGRFCRFDETLGWVGTPGVTGLFTWADCRVDVRQNRYGFRGTDYPFERSQRSRCVVLGDSFVWGFGVDEADLLTSQIETMSGGTVEMVNLGVSGYGTDQEVLLWERLGWQWRPDHVLLFFCFSTDVWDNLDVVRYGCKKPRARIDGTGGLVFDGIPVRRPNGAWDQGPKPVLRSRSSLLETAMDRSDLVCLAVGTIIKWDRFRGHPEPGDMIPNFGVPMKWELPLYRKPVTSEVERSCRLAAALIGRLNEDVKRIGADLTLVFVPSHVQVDPVAWRHAVGSASPADSFDSELPNELFKAVAEQAGVRLIDLTAALRKAAERTRVYYAVNWHWNREGNRVVARALVEELGLNAMPSEPAGRP